ncbi:MAG: LPS-assembly protein LptD, partial [Blastocatellia bacterium]|nr:LPS-assembly protein LptD [Blastocatellia bacterium]
ADIVINEDILTSVLPSKKTVASLANFNTQQNQNRSDNPKTEEKSTQEKAVKPAEEKPASAEEKIGDSHHYLNSSMLNSSSSEEKQQEGSSQENSTETEEGRGKRKQDGSISSSASLSESSPNPATVIIDADEQRKDGDVFIATGYVVIKYANSVLQADKVTYNTTSGEATAEGNVVYDPDPFQRITAHRATLNIYSKRGIFYDATGFTDQTPDGATLNFVAERAEKTGTDTYVLYGVSLTACEQGTPVWQFQADKTRLRINKSAIVRSGIFKFKDVPIFYLPAISIPIGRRERKSGFLIPTTANSIQRGRSFQTSYYQTLGRSADVLLRGDLYTKRGIGIGTNFRVRSDEFSFLRFGNFTVFDRILGENNPDLPDEGGTLLFAKGVQQLPNNFIAAIDVDFTSNLRFRRTFANDIEQVFNPENRSQAYIANNFSDGSGNYTFTFRAERKTDTLFSTIGALNPDPDQDINPNLNIKISHLPSFELTGYDRQIKELPLYVSFDASADALSRQDRLGQQITFETPTIVQRLDLSPKFTLIVPDIAGWVIRPELRLRSTYYTNSLRQVLVPPTTPDGTTILNRQLDPDNIFRNYLEVAVDVRPPSLAKTYTYEDGTPRFKHLIEPFFTYRKISGVDDFDRVIRFDSKDAIADTNELEYGVVNRILVPKESNNGSISTHELFAFALTQKYFFDPDFGGARVSGVRNQFFPINTLSGFNFGGRARRVSPLNFNFRYRPLSSISSDLRFDYDTISNKVRNFSVAGQFTNRFVGFTGRFFRSATTQIEPGRIEPGTFPGSLLFTNVSLGNEKKGLYSGTNLTYDFTNRRDVDTGLRSRAGLRRSSTYIGYACDCGSIEINFTTLNLGGGFRDRRVSFTFTLSGIGSFGTERLQQ